MLGRVVTHDENLRESLQVEVYEATYVDDYTELTFPCTIEKWFDMSGRPHRPGDLPALTIRNIETGNVVAEEYWVEGQRHRENDQPATIYYTDTMDNYQWYWRDQLHREKAQPAQLEIDRDTDTPIGEHWYIHGRPMRPGGGLVSRIRYWSDKIGWHVGSEDWVDAAGQSYSSNGPTEPDQSQRLTHEFP
ncbi:MAG: hypothetical protein ACJA0K_000663 [Maricaulis maris]|jgi:hypothetical protein